MILLQILTLLALASPANTAVPTTEPHTWVQSDDYPKEALENGSEGTVMARLIVGLDGIPKSCSIVESSDVPALDKQTCVSLIQRARFKPSTATTGPIIPIRYQTRVRWVMPAPQPFGSMGSITNIGINDDGTLGKCTEKLIGVAESEMLGVCESMSSWEELEQLFRTEWKAKKEIQIGLYVIAEQEGDGLIVTGDRFNFQQKFYEAQIAVSPAGYIVECKTVLGVGRFEGADFCEELDPKSKEFPADSTTDKNRRMTILFEVKTR